MTFLDTNILLYAISRDAREARKRRIALGLLEERSWVLSVQVLQEFYVQATREGRPDRLDHDTARDLVLSWSRYRIQDVTAEILFRAMETAKARKLSYWDAAIIEAAREAGCTGVYSEDMGHGVSYSGVVVRNPFRQSRSGR